MTQVDKPGVRLAEVRMSRRRVLTAGMLMGAAVWCAPALANALTYDSDPYERSLAFYNTHTSERLKTIYWIQGVYLPEALQEMYRILRDHRANAMRPIDIHLFDLLYAMQCKLETRRPFHVVSGYRTPQTNALLRARRRGVAKNSLHIQGRAVDIRLPGTESAVIRRVALSLHAGGVGYYPQSDFVHVDTGPVRSW